MWYNANGDKMKRQVRIKYKSIFKYDAHQDQQNYDGIGIVSMYPDGLDVSWGTMKVIVRGDTIFLSNETSELELCYQKIVDNAYVTAYGEVMLQTKLESYSYTKDSVRCKYLLMEGNVVISQVYILIQMIDVNEEGSVEVFDVKVS